MARIKLMACPGCGATDRAQSWDSWKGDSVSYQVSCAGCSTAGPKAASDTEARRQWNLMAKRATAGRMLGEAAAEVNAREGVTAERLLALRGRATS